MPRFFVPTKDIDGDKVTILGDDARHIARSLRMAVGDTVTVCDMHKYEHLCRLDMIRDDICELTILEQCHYTFVGENAMGKILTVLRDNNGVIDYKLEYPLFLFEHEIK
jgi:hypothetical protein